MKNILPTLMLAGAALLSVSGAAAQSAGAGQSGAAGAAGSPSAGAQNSSAGSVTVTGCLAQGTAASEFSISDSSGKTYGLMAGGDVNLKPHVGHQVSVTGTTMGAGGAASQKPESSPAPGSAAPGSATPGQAGAAAANAGAAHSEAGQQLHVTELKMISSTCSK